MAQLFYPKTRLYPPPRCGAKTEENMKSEKAKELIEKYAVGNVENRRIYSCCRE